MAKKQYTWNPLTDSVIEETDGAANILVEYTNESSMYGPLISQHRDGESRFFHFDALGSTRELTDENQNVTDTFAYDAWGEVVDHAGTSCTPYQWVGYLGYRKDCDEARFCVRYRLFSGVTARWTAMDLASFTDGFNLYMGMLNSPVFFVDPSGLVTRDFKPEKADSCPWCEVGYSGTAGLPKEFQEVRCRQLGRPYDPDGLYESIWGDTDPVAYKIICTCDCANDERNTYNLKCTVQAYFKIRIAPVNFTRHATLQGVYGHEQLHVKNFLQGAESWAKTAEQDEAQNQGVTRTKCLSAKTGLEVVGNNALKNWITREERHEHPSGKPKAGTNYPPIGMMPQTPDCSFPGKPADVAPPNECC